MKSWIKMKETYICPNCGAASPTQPERCPSCAGYLSAYDGEPSLEETEWVLKISYSWGDEEADRRFRTWKEAVDEMISLASQELLVAGADHDWQVNLFVPADIGIENDKRSEMTIHYEYDDTYCYHVVERFKKARSRRGKRN